MCISDRRQLASWVVESVERSRTQRKRVARLRDAASDARAAGATAAARVQATLGAQLQSTQSHLEELSRTSTSLLRHTDKLLDSVAFFAASRASLRDTLRAMRAWQGRVRARRQAQTAAAFARYSGALRALRAWAEHCLLYTSPSPRDS